MSNTKGKLAKDMTVNKKPFENVFWAAKQGDVNLVRKMIAENPPLKTQVTPIRQRSLLIFAVLSQHLLVVKLLIQLSLDQSLKDTYGKIAKDYAEECLKSSKTKQEQVQAKNILSLLA